MLGYPFISYTFQQHNYGRVLPVILAGIICWRGFKTANLFQRNYLFGGAVFIVAGSIVLGKVMGQLMPVMIYLALAWFFARTLISPPSLIERFVKLQFSDIPQEVLSYCRQLTAVWTVFFSVVVFVSILLIVTGNDWYLTVLHGVIIWVLMAMLMLVEHFYRVKRFPFMKDHMPSIASTIQSAINSKEQLW